MSIAVTGASGFVGSYIVQELKLRGLSPVSFVRKATTSDQRSYTLGESAAPNLFDGIKVLVHVAYDFTSRDASFIRKINVDGSRALFKAAQNAGVEKIIFISSMAAFDGTPSQYGQGKLEVEKMVLSLPHSVCIRPGVVWSESPRGLMGTLKKFATLPVVPYFTGENLCLYLVHAVDLARVVVDCSIEVPTDSRIISCASSKPLVFKEILRRLSGKKSPIMIPIPTTLTYWALRFLESLGLKPPFASDSLVGLINANMTPENLISNGLKEI